MKTVYELYTCFCLKERMVREYLAANGTCTAVTACAACGIRDPKNPAENFIVLESLPLAHWLRFTKDDTRRVDEYPVVKLYDAKWDSKEVSLCKIVSYFEDPQGRRYHVHPELLYPSTDNGGSGTET